MRAQLDAADTAGVPALADKASSGGRLSAEQRKQVDSYNDLLEAYLDGACQNQGKP